MGILALTGKPLNLGKAEMSRGSKGKKKGGADDRAGSRDIKGKKKELLDVFRVLGLCKFDG